MLCSFSDIRNTQHPLGSLAMDISTNKSFLAEALSALSGQSILQAPEDHDKTETARTRRVLATKSKFDMDSLHKHTLTWVHHSPAPPPAPSVDISVSVKMLTGQTILVDTNTADTVEEMKLKVQDKEGIPPDQQRIIHTGLRLLDARTLSSYKIEDGTILHLNIRLRGGGALMPMTSWTRSITLTSQS